MKIYPVILSGGAGSRLWPLSRAALPKQLLPLVSDKTMLQETALRLAGWPEMMAPLLICGDEHRFLVAEQMRDIAIEPLAIMLESVGRNTAPAVAAAAWYLQALDPQAIMLVLPADHVIEDRAAFHAAIDNALQAASQEARWPPSASCRRHRKRGMATSVVAPPSRAAKRATRLNVSWKNPML